MKVVRLSALHTGRLYPPTGIPCIHSCQRPGRTRDHIATGRIKSMKNLKDSIGNWSRGIPGCRAGPQQTAIPRVLTFITNTRLKQTRPRGNEAAKTFAWQIIRCPHAWTKSIVRSVPRQYMQVSGADIDIVLWVVTCYLMWIGTRKTNTKFLREGARFGQLNISRQLLDRV